MWTSLSGLPYFPIHFEISKWTLEESVVQRRFYINELQNLLAVVSSHWLAICSSTLLHFAVLLLSTSPTLNAVYLRVPLLMSSLGQ